MEETSSDSKSGNDKRQLDCTLKRARLRTILLAIGVAMRSTLLLVCFSLGGIYFNRRGFYPPHGSTLVYALTISWLIAIAVVLPASVFFKRNQNLLALTRWEKDGEVYDRPSIRAFRWLVLHSPFGWINPALHLRGSRTDCQRLLSELNVAEGVHWLTFVFSSILAIAYLSGGYTVYGCVMLVVRIPFDVYPIMLQRWNRGRLCRVLSRQLRTPGRLGRTPFIS